MLKLITRAQARLNSIRDEEGATATEYALVLGIVAIGLVVAAAALLPLLDTWVDDIQAWMDLQVVGEEP